ncbi:MAG: hypothetical protein HN509_07830, partial [Halobacteriovoraceae bacterium]|nr:hypothetical protein [Halobacteriovoraceae bacterium]
LKSYNVNRTTPTGVAGSNTIWRITAFDQAGNLMAGATNKAELDSRTFTFSDNSGGTLNGPEAGVASLTPATTLTWNQTTATANFNVTPFNKANGIVADDIHIQDDFGTPVSATNTEAMTIAGAAGNHFHIQNTGFPSNATANQDLATRISVQLQDIYGNPTLDPAVTNVTLALNQISGYTNTGTMNISTTDGGGAPSDITAETPSFVASSSLYYFDIAYDVGHVVELLASHASVPGGTAGAASDDMTFTVVSSTVQQYALNFDIAGTKAGDPVAASLVAQDGGGNTITGQDGVLNTIGYTFTSTNASFDAPNASQTVAGNDPADGSLTFVNGSSTLTWRFYQGGTVPTGQVTVTDNTNTIVRANQNTLAMQPATASDYLFINPLESIIASSTTLTAQARDQYNNLDTNYQIDFDLVTDGSATHGTTVNIANGSGTIQISDLVAETVNLSMNDVNVTGNNLDTEDVIFTGPPDHFAYITEPISNETINKTFGTGAIVEVRDATGTRVFADNATPVTLSPFTNAACGIAGAGTFTNNTGTVVAGRLTLGTLQYDTAENIFTEISGGGLTVACAVASTTVFASLAIDNPPGANFQTGEVYTFEVSGGVPPLTTAASVSNSGGTLGLAYSGGSCTAGRNCYDFTPGTTVAVNDIFDIRDSASVQNMASTTRQTDGSILNNIGDPVAWGNTALDVSKTFTIRNDGNINAGALAVTFNSADASYWDKNPDFCDTNTLAPAATCDITITFLGATGNTNAPANGFQSSTLVVIGATNGTSTLNLTATRDGAIFNNIGDTVAWGNRSKDFQKTFTIRNDGNANSGVIASVFTPGDATYWSVDADACNTSNLNAAATCDIDITFLGETGNSGNVANGAQAATLTVTGATGGVTTLSLTATRDGAIFNNTGAAPGWGNTASDVQKTFTITNNGNANSGVMTTVFTPADASYWSVDSDACNTSNINGAATCDIQITFLGASGNTANPVNGAQSATLSVTGATGGQEILSLTATRDGAILNNIGQTGAYGTTGTDDQRTFTIQNDGNATTGALSVVFTPADAGYWSLDVDNCNTVTLGAAANCDISITFLGATGNGSAPVSGPQAGTLTITGGTAGIRVLNLTGTIP